MALAVGDLVVVVVLVAAGAIHHGRTAPLHILSVSVPFVVGWFIVAPTAGAYSGYPSARNELFATVGAWTVSVLIALGIRSTSFFAGDSPLSFGFVMIVVGGTAVVVWRLLVARLLVAAVRWTR